MKFKVVQDLFCLFKANFSNDSYHMAPYKMDYIIWVILYGPYDISKFRMDAVSLKLKIALVKYLLNFVFSPEIVFDIFCHRNGFLFAIIHGVQFILIWNSCQRVIHCVERQISYSST